MHQLEGYARLAVNVLRTYLEVDLSKKLKSPESVTDSMPTDPEKMLLKCTPEAARFFRYILEAATQQGHTIYWGTVGFSIRTRLPGSDDLATIAYCFPPERFQIYFAHLPFSEEKIFPLRKQLLGLGIFKEGPKTLTAQLKADNIQRAKEAYTLMERRVKELSTK